MEEQKIKSITSYNNLGSKNYTVGFGDVKSIKGGLFINEPNSIIIYDVFSNEDKLICRFINGNLAIEYF